MTHLLRAEREGKIEMADLFMNAPIIVGAGSQTTATLLSGATFLLLTHPRAMQTAVKEIRDSFQRDEEINLVGINKCHYLLAVLDEYVFKENPSPIDSGIIRNRSSSVIGFLTLVPSLIFRPIC